MRPSFLLFCSPNIIMYILNIAIAIKKIPFNELRDFVFENCYKRFGFEEKSVLFNETSEKRSTIVCN